MTVLLKHTASVKVGVKLPSFLSIPPILALLLLEEVKGFKVLKTFISPQDRLQGLLTDQQCVLTGTCENED